MQMSKRQENFSKTRKEGRFMETMLDPEQLKSETRLGECLRLRSQVNINTILLLDRKPAERCKTKTRLIMDITGRLQT